MACSTDFVQYITDQCAGAGEIAVKKMMGDYCIYCDGILFGLIYDNNFYISDMDDRDNLTCLIRATIPALPKQKMKKNPMK